MLRVMNDFEGKCPFCGHVSCNMSDFELHEIEPDRWEFICNPCVEVCDLDYGK